MSIDTTVLRRCTGTLEFAFSEVDAHRKAGGFVHDMYHAACVKECELVLE